MPFKDPEMRRRKNAEYARKARALFPSREHATQTRYRETGKKPMSRMSWHVGVCGIPSTALAAKYCDTCGEFCPMPQLDHDHKHNVFRGTLCHRCNVLMGKVDADPTRLALYHEGLRYYYEGAQFS